MCARERSVVRLLIYRMSDGGLNRIGQKVDEMKDEPRRAKRRGFVKSVRSQRLSS